MFTKLELFLAVVKKENIFVHKIIKKKILREKYRFFIVRFKVALCTAEEGMICAKLKIKIVVYFVTSVFSFILNSYCFCIMKIKINRYTDASDL